jgi:hypothetical protein
LNSLFTLHSLNRFCRFRFFFIVLVQTVNVGLSSGACGSLVGTSNGAPASDAMVSVYAHEIVEAASDPELDAYFFMNGMENADMCAWMFGSYLPGSVNANMQLGTKKYLVQQNWKRRTPASEPGCVSSF